MELAGRAITLIHYIDQKQTQVIGQINVEMQRMTDRFEEINTLKKNIEQSHIETTSNLQQLFESTKAFADETKTNIKAGASAKPVSETKANFVHGSLILPRTRGSLRIR